MLRGIDRAVFARLVVGDWIDAMRNLFIIEEPASQEAGSLALFGHKACRGQSSIFTIVLPNFSRLPRVAMGVMPVAQNAWTCSTLILMIGLLV